MAHKTLFDIKAEIINKRLASFAGGYRQNVALLGNDSREITSLLDAVQFSDEYTVIRTFAFFTDTKSFFKSVVSCALSEFIHRDVFFDELLSIAEPLLERTTVYARETLKKNIISFNDALEFLTRFISESKKKCVFVIEEFQALADVYPAPFKDFSKFLVTQRTCMVLLTSAQAKKASKILGDELNLLFGNFEIAELDTVPYVQSYSIVKEELQAKNPSAFFLSQLTALSSGNAVYQKILSEAAQSLYQPADPDNGLSDIMEHVLFPRESFLHQTFYARMEFLRETTRDFLSVSRILYALAGGYSRKEDLARISQCEAKEFSAKLARLADTTLVQSQGNMYHLSDTLFSFWLAHVFQLYAGNAVRNPQRRQKIFRYTIRQHFSAALEEFNKNSSKRIVDLISLFRNDTVKIGSTRYRLPAIEKTKIVSYPDKKLHILLGEGKEILFAAIKERGAEDSDIVDFLEKGHGIQGKGVNRMFITTDHFSPAAQLLAKDNHITAWGINELNEILPLYNKPPLLI